MNIKKAYRANLEAAIASGDLPDDTDTDFLEAILHETTDQGRWIMVRREGIPGLEPPKRTGEPQNPICRVSHGNPGAKGHQFLWEKVRWRPGARIPAMAKSNQDGGMTILKWQIGWDESLGEPPRTCSFCGGIHPDDAIRMIEEGWEPDPTTKGYKLYMEPPGTRAARRRRQQGAEDPGGLPGPTPPVKLYTYHLDEGQIERCNDLLQEQLEAHNAWIKRTEG